VRIDGFCPMGCGTTLALSAQGQIACAGRFCPNPVAVQQILGDSETEHIVEFMEENFVIRHPLRERVDDALLECELHHYLSALDGPPVAGRYRARRRTEKWQHEWVYERLGDRDAEEPLP
jgi:hypothetical protein